MNFNEVCHFFLLNSKNMAPFSTNFDPISIRLLLLRLKLACSDLPPCNQFLVDLPPCSLLHNRF